MMMGLGSASFQPTRPPAQASAAAASAGDTSTRLRPLSSATIAGGVSLVLRADVHQAADAERLTTLRAT